MSFRPHTSMQHTPGGGWRAHTEMRHVSTSSHHRPVRPGPPGQGCGFVLLLFVVLGLLCAGGLSLVKDPDAFAPTQPGISSPIPGKPTPHHSTKPSRTTHPHPTSSKTHPHPTDSKAHPHTTPAATQHYDISVHQDCGSSTGTSTRCTILIRNNPGSTTTFHWTGSSQPGGAQFSPATGTVPRGTTSAPITVTIPLGDVCPVRLAFTSPDTFTATALITSVNGEAC